MKNSFIFYTTWARMLAAMPDEQLTILTRAIMCYVCGEDFSIDDLTVSAVFEVIRDKLDEDAAKYEETCRKRVAASRKRWGDSNTEMQMDANECKCIQVDGDTDTDTDTDIKEKYIKRKKQMHTNVSKCTFNNFPQRNYNYDDIEAKLLKGVANEPSYINRALDKGPGNKDNGKRHGSSYIHFSR